MMRRLQQLEKKVLAESSKKSSEHIEQNIVFEKLTTRIVEFTSETVSINDRLLTRLRDTH